MNRSVGGRPQEYTAASAEAQRPAQPKAPAGSVKSYAAFTRYAASLSCCCTMMLRFIDGKPQRKAAELCLPCVARQALKAAAFNKAGKRVSRFNLRALRESGL